VGGAASQVSTNPQGECSHSPRGSGATVGYHKKGYPKQEPKRLLRPYKYQSRRTTTGPRPILRFAPPRPSRRGPLAEADSRRGPLAGCPIHLMRMNAPTTSATTSRVWQQERWDIGPISFLPSLTDGAGVTMPCGHMPCTFPPKPGTTLTTEAPASYSGHLPGLYADSHKHLPGLDAPPSQQIHRAWHVTYREGHAD